MAEIDPVTAWLQKTEAEAASCASPTSPFCPAGAGALEAGGNSPRSAVSVRHRSNSRAASAAGHSEAGSTGGARSKSKSRPVRPGAHDLEVLGIERGLSQTAEGAVVSRMTTVRSTRKSPGEPERMCEAGCPPPLLPWESVQRVEWRICNLEKEKKLLQVKYHGAVMSPGLAITSPVFQACSLQGTLRFWPNGFFNVLQKRERGEMDLGGLNAYSWCAIGAFFPEGTHLRLRLFVGDSYSDFRDCYWLKGAGVKQLWMPNAAEPPDMHGEPLVVGIEVAVNHRKTFSGAVRKPPAVPVEGAGAEGRAASAPTEFGRRGRRRGARRERRECPEDLKEAGVPALRPLMAPGLAKLPAPRTASLTRWPVEPPRRPAHGEAISPQMGYYATGPEAVPPRRQQPAC